MGHHSIISDEDKVCDEHAGEHLSGHERLALEEARKTSFFGQFHANREHFNEGHGDRNRMGSHDSMSGYDRESGHKIRKSYE